MNERIVAIFFVATSTLACGPVVADDTSDTSNDVEVLGERPMQAGAMYSTCSSVTMCGSLEFCVYPRGDNGTLEQGYCSAACAATADPSSCDPAPGEGAIESCLDIGIEDGRQVCALDCAEGRRCPLGMRCEAIMSPSGERHVCF